MATAKSRFCHNAGAEVFEGTGPTVLDALAAVIDDLAKQGNDNPSINGAYVWDDPCWKPGDDRVVIVTVMP